VPRQRLGRGFPSGGHKRQVTWVGPADQFTVNVSSGASGINQSFDPAAAGMVKPTIVRVRGLLLVKLQAYTTDQDVNGAFGMCVVSDEAFAAGAASIPRPFDDAGWDGWFVWQPFSFRYEFHSATGDIIGSVGWDIDSKAMRKVTDNETVVCMVESQSGAFAASVNTRVLFKLS